MKKKIVILLTLIFSYGGMDGFAVQGNTGVFHSRQKEKVKNFQEQQHKERRTFRESLEGKSLEEKKQALKDFLKSQRTGKQEFREKMHEENKAFLRERLEKNKKLTEAEKAELINFFEEQYQENVLFRQGKASEQIAFFEKITSDSNLTLQQKRSAIKDYLDAQKKERKANFLEQKSEGQEVLEKIR